MDWGPRSRSIYPQQQASEQLELSISMRSIFRICNDEFFTEQRTSAAANWNRRRDRLHDINPEIEIELHQCRFSSENATQIVSKYDIVVDG